MAICVSAVEKCGCVIVAVIGRRGRRRRNMMTMQIMVQEGVALKKTTMKAKKHAQTLAARAA